MSSEEEKKDDFEIRESESVQSEESAQKSLNEEPKKTQEIQVQSSTTYIGELDKIMRSLNSPENKITMIDLVIKDYLRKKFHFKKTLEYSEMIEFFLEKNKPEIATFCHEMIEALYSGETMDINRMGIIAEDFRNLLSKEENEKVHSEKEPSLRNIADPILSIFRHKKQKTPAGFNSSYVSKQIKKAVESTLIETAKKEDSRKESKKHPLIYQLNPAESPGFANASPRESDHYESIENIDDFDRIKQKIKDKKSMAYTKAEPAI